MNPPNNDLIPGNLKNGEYTTLAYFPSEEIYTQKDKEEYAISDEQWNSLLVPNNESAYKEFKANKYDESKGTRYKYRAYFKAVKDGVETKNDNLLTFIMFNPSTTHQYSLDDTVKNCLELAEKNGFNGIEVLNLLNIRNPRIDNINICDSASNKDCKINLVCKNVVLAWGSRNFCNRGMSVLNENLQKFLNQDRDEDRKFYTLIKNKTRHPGNQAWTRNNGFKAAKLWEFKVTNVDKLKILKGGEL